MTDPNQKAREMEKLSQSILKGNKIVPRLSIDPNQSAMDLEKLTIAISKRPGERLFVTKPISILEVPSSKRACECKYDVQYLQSQKNNKLKDILGDTTSDEWNDNSRNAAIVKISKMIKSCCTCSKSKIMKKGIKHHLVDPVGKSVRSANEVTCRHVDKERDEKLGYSLSDYNLNYTFESKKIHSSAVSFTSVYPESFNTSLLPTSCDPIRHLSGQVYDQGQLGSCASNSCAYSLRYIYAKEKLGSFLPSRLFIYYNGRVLSSVPLNQDTGLSIGMSYNSVKTNGVCPENTDWVYDIKAFSVKPTVKAYTDAKNFQNLKVINLPQNLNVLQQCIFQGYPISFGATLYTSFMSETVAKNGNVPYPDKINDTIIGGHAITIVAYDNNHVNASDGSKGNFLVANSWGTLWGINGFFWMPYVYVLDQTLCSDFWSARVFT